jgi:hypothetical protein
MRVMSLVTRGDVLCHLLPGRVKVNSMARANNRPNGINVAVVNTTNYDDTDFRI